MTKDQFLTALSGALSALSETDRKITLDFYSEMIDDRIEDGMDEGDAVAALGDIDEIIREVLAELPAEDRAAAETPAVSNRMTFTESIHALDIASKDVCLTLLHGDLPEGETARVVLSPADVPFMSCEITDGTLTLCRIRNEARDSIGNLLKKFIGLRGVSLRCEITLSSKALHNACIRSASGGVRISSLAFEEELNVESLSGSVQAEAVSAPTLCIHTTSGALRLSDATFSVFSGSTASGSLKVENLSGKRMTLDSASGPIRLSTVRVPSLELSTASGSIHAEDVAAATLETGAASGSVRLSSVTAESVAIGTASGSISVEDARVANELSANAASGSIKLNSVEASGFTLSTNSGNISGTLSGEPESYSFHARSQCGRVSVPDTDGPRKVCATTNSGAISLAF